MELNLIEDFGSFSVYEHPKSGKGILMQNNYKGRKANAAVFDNVSEALSRGLAVVWGAKINLTYRIPNQKD